jgi:L-arabinose isomerase
MEKSCFKKKIKIGYLPLYIKLYDDYHPGIRAAYEDYMKKLVGMIEDKGFEVVLADEVCRVKEEFDRAAAKFNADNDIAAVVTQHLAYSPSLESIDALLSLKAPIVVFDTTPDYQILKYADTEDRIMPNHGIHGVQDMCNMLRRNGKNYQLCVGHASEPAVMNELCDLLKGAAVASAMRNSRIGMVGGEFEGMGDFRLPDEQLRRELGVETVRMTPEEGVEYTSKVTEAEIDAEIAADKERFDVRVDNETAYRDATKAGLAVRRWMNDKKLSGVTVNFLHTDLNRIPKMPFVECCKVMERCQGYAGEGDNLTASLTGALIRVFPDTTFTEMFCPDWENNMILLSHMGEMNPRLTQHKPVLTDKKFNYNSCGDTTTVCSSFRAGRAVLVNLAPAKEGFTLILSEVELTDETSHTSAYATEVQGWLKPSKPLRQFLKRYSVFGGTHHSALVYGFNLKAIAAFGKLMGFETVII